ncbi:MAG: DoxX family protein [Thermoanaerobaculia bacterium]|nr:DoxX family protein [Thermoanaerobaculia bacterium]
MTIASWVLRIGIAAVLLQTLFFKFSGAPESVHIFETLGAEPWGRWASGLAELAASVLVLLPHTRAWGALLALGIMAGAIGSHLAVLGIEVQGDGGLLFGLAVTVFLASAALVTMHRGELPRLGR